MSEGEGVLNTEWLIIARRNSSDTKSHESESIYSDALHAVQSEKPAPHWDTVKDTQVATPRDGLQNK